MTEAVEFYLQDGAKVKVSPLAATNKLGKRYKFVIFRLNGKEQSFEYTPLDTMTEEQKNDPGGGYLEPDEQEALRIFQNKF